MLRTQSLYLKSKKIPKKRIWVDNDAWYTSKNYCDTIRKLEHNSVCGLRCNWRIRLFGKWMRVDKYLKRYQKERYFTSKDDNIKIIYKQATLDLSKIGRRKVFCFKKEGSKKCKYYICNKLDVTPKMAYEHMQQRWSIETLHRTVKQYFGLKSCYSRKKESILGHYNLSYFLYWIFSIYRVELDKLGIKTTIEDLWHEYIVESNFIRYNGENYNMLEHILLQRAFS